MATYKKLTDKQILVAYFKFTPANVDEFVKVLNKEYGLSYTNSWLCVRNSNSGFTFFRGKGGIYSGAIFNTSKRLYLLECYLDSGKVFDALLFSHYCGVSYQGIISFIRRLKTGVKQDSWAINQILKYNTEQKSASILGWTLQDVKIRKTLTATRISKKATKKLVKKLTEKEIIIEQLKQGLRNDKQYTKNY